MVQLSLFLIKHHAIEAHGIVEIWFLALLTMALHGGEWCA